MKGAQKRAPSRRDLLELWVGQPESSARRPRKPASPWVVVGAVLAVLVTLALARYAIDVLFVALGLAALGLVFHALGNWLAESDILSPGWFTIITLGVLLGAWAFLMPADGLLGLGRYVPKPVAEAFARMESRGWARTAFVGPGGGGPASRGSGPIDTAPISRDAAPARSGEPPSSAAASSAPSLTLTASAASRFGEPVMLTARLAEGVQADEGTARVRFYDGRQLLGTVGLQREGRAIVAYLTVNGLAAGEHQIRAELAGPLGLPAGTSGTVRHTVR